MADWLPMIKPAPLQIGNGQSFFASASFNISAVVLVRCTARHKRRWKTFACVGALMIKLTAGLVGEHPAAELSRVGGKLAVSDAAAAAAVGHQPEEGSAVRVLLC